MNLEQEVRAIATLALSEDHAREDITSQACIDGSAQAKAAIVLKKDARVAGLIFLPWILDLFDPSIKLQIHVAEGQDCISGTTLATLEGNALSLLGLERTALNLIQHVSGIATTTARYVQSVSDHTCMILDTRKTLPGLRAVQKYGVKMGGGHNHRFHLKDSILIKNNHLRLLKQSTQSPIATAIEKARSKFPDVKLEIEVEDLEMLDEAFRLMPDVIMLDNMSVDHVSQAVRRTQGKVYLEASGGITLATVKSYAATGVNGISIGALTHSSNAIDMSMRIVYDH